MADGKVMQKYIPPDFDPETLRKNKDLLRSLHRASGAKKRKRGGRMMDMRMMFPFTLCCDSCKDFVYVGTKFNSKVERMRGAEYLGIPIWRFYGRCPHCRHQIVFRTDPKNTDYVLESGGTRTYDPHRDAGLATEALKQAQDKEIQEDAVKALEIKSYSTAEELKSMAALDELRRINRQFLNKNVEASEFALQKLQERHEDNEDKLDEEEMAEARLHFLKRDFEEDENDDGGGWSSEEDDTEEALPVPRAALIDEDSGTDKKRRVLSESTYDSGGAVLAEPPDAVREGNGKIKEKPTRDVNPPCGILNDYDLSSASEAEDDHSVEVKS